MKKQINEYLENQIIFTDRYFDGGLIDRLFALSGLATETITIAEGVSYAVFQDTLDETNTMVTARDQLDDFLAGVLAGRQGG